MAFGRRKTGHGFRLLAFLAIFSDSAAAASLQLLTPPSALNASYFHGSHCNNLPSWTGGSPRSSNYDVEDCKQAIRMFEQDVARNPGEAQWLSLGFPDPVPGYGPPVWTPKRYTSGTCVLAIANLVDVGDIPSKPGVSGPVTAGVIATWRAVSEYVQVLSELCLVRLSALGWTDYKDSQLGIFLWATDSPMNRRVPRPDRNVS